MWDYLMFLLGSCSENDSMQTGFFVCAFEWWNFLISICFFKVAGQNLISFLTFIIFQSFEWFNLNGFSKYSCANLAYFWFWILTASHTSFVFLHGLQGVPECTESSPYQYCYEPGPREHAVWRLKKTSSFWIKKWWQQFRVCFHLVVIILF